MSCKMLIFDFREFEKDFFKKNKFENFDIKFFNWSLNDDTVNNISPEDFDHSMIISIFTTSKITQTVINKFKNLRIISTRSTGIEHIDTAACVNKNITLINVEGYGCKSVAQFTFTLILMLVRNMLPAIEAVRRGSCVLPNFTGQNIETMTLGIIGTGSIGGAVCEIASKFGMKILAYDPAPKKELEKNYNVEYLEFDEVLKNSDIISLHVPYNEDNKYLISSKQFNLMKKSAYFVNTSRGELVNLTDLLKVIKNNHLKGVGLDVVACLDSACLEGAQKNERNFLSCLEESKVVQELNKQPNVIITPHIAYDTQDSADYVLEKTFSGLTDFLYGGKKYRVF